MTNKKILLFLMVGLLAISFTLPALATSRPSYALNPEDVPGWWLYSEGSPPGSPWEVPWLLYTFNISAWYQIWINNNTAWSTAPQAWANATAAMGLLVIDFGIDIDNWRIGPISVDIWDLFIVPWFNTTGTVVSIPGLDGAIVYRSTNVWWGIGYSGQLLIIAIGWGSTSPPGNPFVAGKDPADSGATQGNIVTLMGAQGSQFSSGIPGFTIVPILISMVVLLSIIYLIRKDQLVILKSK
jgi:hypothetical protein